MSHNTIEMNSGSMAQMNSSSGGAFVYGYDVFGEVITKKIGRMQQGFAPRVAKSQRYGDLSSYVLHHKTPIHAGGGVYDFDNLVIVTQRMHQEILDKAFHFGD